jgi:tol-pal system protein YbgF
MNRRVQPFAIPVLAAALLVAMPVRAQDNAVAADQEVRIQQLEGQIRSLNGQLEQMNYRVQQMSDRLDKLVADMDYRLRQVEGGNAPPPGQGMAEQQGAASPPPQPAGQMPEQQATTESYNSGGGSGTQSAGGGGAPPANLGQPKTLGTMSQSQYNTQTQQLNQNADAGAASAAAANTGAPAAANNQQAYALPGANADEQYQYAFDLMRQTKYAEAEKALSTFVDDYPDHPLAGNASYWLGETYYVRKDYNNAAQTFAQTFQKYPQSAKAPDSLLKLGMSLAALGETGDACKALHELKVRYPKAPDGTKQRAAKEWAKNGCK